MSLSKKNSDIDGIDWNGVLSRMDAPATIPAASGDIGAIFAAIATRPSVEPGTAPLETSTTDVALPDQVPRAVAVISQPEMKSVRDVVSCRVEGTNDGTGAGRKFTYRLAGRIMESSLRKLDAAITLSPGDTDLEVTLADGAPVVLEKRIRGRIDPVKFTAFTDLFGI